MPYWRQTPSPHVDLARLDATSDDENNDQRIAELDDDVPQATMNSVPELTHALHISPSTIRRLRRGSSSPSAAILCKLQEQLADRA